MQTIPFEKYNLSRLMLGTVQFGLDYGISNDAGKPSYSTVREIVACAVEAGVNCLDTARTYGDSEEVISRVIADLDIADSVIVGTKVIHLTDRYSDRKAERAVRDSVHKSLETLRLDALPLCMLHLEQDFRHIDALLRLKEAGLVRNVGVSVLTPGTAAEIVKSGLVDAVQAPVSILDRRFVEAGVLAEARKRDVAVFARSVYLQGLLLMPDEETPIYLSEVIPVRRKLRRIASEAGMCLHELAVRYVLGLDGVASVVMGVLSVEHMRQNCRLVSKEPLTPELAQAVEETVPVLSDDVVMPDRWPDLDARFAESHPYAVGVGR